MPGGARYIRNASRWWDVYAPKLTQEDKSHPLLCHLWEETEGLFAVFADSTSWGTIDPSSDGISLEQYVAVNDDWKTYRVDGTKADPENVDGDPIAVTDVCVQLDVKPSGEVSELSAVSIGEILATKIAPSVGGSIGEGSRIAELKTGIEVIKVSK